MLSRLPVILALLASLAFTQDTDFREWMLPNFSKLEAKVESINTGEVHLIDRAGQSHALPFRELTPEDQLEVMRQTGWGRVWQDNTGKFKFIGDLVSVGDKSVLLENVDGEQITVDFERLSKTDQQYAKDRKQTTEDSLPETFSAKVVGVHDGDTVTLLLNQKQFKVRLDGIDAPEIGQAYGDKAKRHLSSLVAGKTVKGQRLGGDKYGRNICKLGVDKPVGSVNLNMVEQGLAWHYVKYSTDRALADAQIIAKREKRNLWSESGPIPPWDWRKMSSADRKNFLLGNSANKLEPTAEKPAEEKAAAPMQPLVTTPPATEPTEPAAKPPAPTEPAAKPEEKLSHWLNTSNNTRHNSGCRWYSNTKKGRKCSASEGHACGQCGGCP